MKADDILSDKQNALQGSSGVTLRKGTILATILNANAFDTAQKSGKLKEIEALEADVVALLPALHDLKLFEFFSLQEWLSVEVGREGRAWVALLYLKHYGDQVTDAARSAIDGLAETSRTILESYIKQVAW